MHVNAPRLAAQITTIGLRDGLPIATGNVKGFAQITGLRSVNPWDK